MSKLVTVALLVVLVGASLAGCLKKPGAPVVEESTDTNVTADAAALPDGRGESAAIKETDAKTNDSFAVQHMHDYWRGRDTVTLLKTPIGVGCPPCMPDGENTQPKSVAYVKLDKLPDDSGTSAMVYEGADSVSLVFDAPTTFNLPHPSPPKLFMQYRSAADAAWKPPQDVTYGTPLVIPVTAQMTDMPHSTHSLWVFRLTTDRPEPSLDVPMTVTVHRGANVVDWPGHPDFYADKTSRIVMQQHVTTHMSGLESFALYDSGGSWATPEKLISWQTKQLHVIFNVTKVTNAYNKDATGFFLEAHNATIIGPEVTFGSRYSDADEPADLKSWDFYVPVDDGGMDGPYQPASRWGFRAMATFADVQGVVGLCPGCFPYDIEYDIVVLAMNFEEKALK
jgi:hypothetical protein